VVLYVTHNLDDAFAIGHRLAVVIGGRVQQIGETEDVYLRPANLAVMETLGIPNRISATVESVTGEGTFLNWCGSRLEAPPGEAVAGESVCAYLRPEQIKLHPAATCSGNEKRLSGRIEAVRVNRSFRVARVMLENGNPVEARVPLEEAERKFTAGLLVTLEVRKDGVVVVPSVSGQSK
jgi:molybdate transport system ATP-binding protein